MRMISSLSGSSSRSFRLVPTTMWSGAFATCWPWASMPTGLLFADLERLLIECLRVVGVRLIVLNSGISVVMVKKWDSARMYCCVFSSILRGCKAPRALLAGQVILLSCPFR